MEKLFLDTSFGRVSAGKLQPSKKVLTLSFKKINIFMAINGRRVLFEYEGRRYEKN